MLSPWIADLQVGLLGFTWIKVDFRKALGLLKTIPVMYWPNPSPAENYFEAHSKGVLYDILSVGQMFCKSQLFQHKL